MKNIFAKYLLLLIYPPLAFGGAAPSKISCQSVDQEIKGIVLEGVWGAEYKITLDDGESQELFDYKNSMPLVVEAVEDGVFYMALARKDRRDLMLYALPKTISQKTELTKRHAKFEAVLKKAPKPGFDGPVSARAFVSNIRMLCVYDWSL